ncbi:MAG: methionine--tRNA ligase [Alphaproteobacteria bacterium]|nr:methionine--tRNA ligase [Alphaproteobacteria bacterium]MBN2779595.1 methionine--tRNA ligase [Alphaproteobacteria bacterium]
MKKNLITSALLYINGEPHLGHMVGCLLPADVYARYRRLKDEEALFIGGTDEHGAAIEIAAQKAGKSYRDYCDELFAQHKSIYQDWNLSFDYLGRTSDVENHALVQEIFKTVDKAGFIEEKTMKQMYSIEDKRFLADRYIKGTCPHCGAEGVDGDQCESCTKLLDPMELKDPYSAISGSKNLEVRETKHLYLKLSSLQGDLESWIETKDWNKTTKSIAQKWLTEGLQDRCITRDLEWGVSVPKAGYEGKVFYVWFDAPFGYISMTQKWATENNKNWEDWWKSDQVDYTQFMAKDNVPFHTVFFPAVEIASKQNFHLVDDVSGVNYLTMEHRKFSKSKKVGVFASQAKSEFPIDYWRYYLTAHIPEGSDANFSFEEFIMMINKDLNDVLGNFVLRVMKFYIAKWGTKTPESPYLEPEIISKLESVTQDYKNAFDTKQFRKGMIALRSIWTLGNEYIAEKEPWSVYKTDPDQAKKMIETGLKLIGLFAVLAKPIIPESAEKIEKMITDESLKLPISDLKIWFESWSLKSEIEKPEAVFEKIDLGKVDELKAKYGGKKD